MKKRTIFVISMLIVTMLSMVTVAQAGVIQNRFYKAVGEEFIPSELIYIREQINGSVNRIFPNIPDELHDKIEVSIYTIYVTATILCKQLKGVLTVHPILHTILNMIFQFIALFIGHNFISYSIVFWSTIWFVAPAIMLQNVGGFGVNWSLLRICLQQELDNMNVDELFYTFGLLALIVYPFIYITCFMIAMSRALAGSGQEGSFIDRVIKDIQDTYNLGQE